MMKFLLIMMLGYGTNAPVVHVFETAQQCQLAGEAVVKEYKKHVYENIKYDAHVRDYVCIPLGASNG